jgi:hypothetical protein
MVNSGVAAQIAPIFWLGDQQGIDFPPAQDRLKSLDSIGIVHEYQK